MCSIYNNKWYSFTMFFLVYVLNMLFENSFLFSPMCIMFHILEEQMSLAECHLAPN
jgi:hypothetical protein